MTEKRFELVNNDDKYDIVDYYESEIKTKEKGVKTICIYNDLGDVGFSSAPQLCDLLNEMYDENLILNTKLDYVLSILRKNGLLWKNEET